MKKFFVVLSLLACLPLVHAAAIRQELQASAAQTASSNSASFKISTITQAAVFVDITTGSGTVLDFDIWIEVSSDGGTTWYAMPPDAVVDNTAAGKTATWTTDLDDVFIIDSKTTTTAQQSAGIYKNLAADYIRVRWTLTGTTPSLTFSVKMVGK